MATSPPASGAGVIEPDIEAPPPKGERSDYANMVRGSAWSIALRWSVRAIGLVNVVILARLLTPEDFALLAMGSLTMGFIGRFMEVGIPMLLIREQDAGREDFDTAWTVMLLQSLLLSAVVFSLAPLAASYFSEPRAVLVVRVLAITPIISGFGNVGIILARKELDFSRDFRYHLYNRLISFSITLVLALTLKSYWALVLGSVFATIAGVPMSYYMHPYRPWFCLSQARKYLRFAFVMIPVKLGNYLNKKADVLAVGALGATAQLGAYNVASELSSMLTREILGPVGRGLMPNFAKMSHDPRGLAKAYGHVLSASGAVVFPFGVGLAVVAPDAVPTLLGEKWLSAVPLVQFLAIYSMLAGLTHMMSTQILVATGHETMTARLTWLRLGALVPAVYLATRIGDVVTVAKATVIAAAVVFPVIVYALSRAISLPLTRIGAAMWRPFVASVTMGGVVVLLRAALSFPHVVNLAIEVAVGALVYTALALALWRVVGKPPGLERLLLDYAARKLRRATA